jgi:hypothetical protein
MIFNTLYASAPEKLEDIICKESEEKAAKIRRILADTKMKDLQKAAAKQVLNDDFDISSTENISDDLDKKRNFNIKSPNQAYYYNPKRNKASLGYYSHSYGPGMIINRVPQTVLGHNVLGRAFIGINYIEILETLQGHDFEEVNQHEINHLIYPNLSEQQIKDKTRYELPFAAKYN